MSLFKHLPARDDKPIPCPCGGLPREVRTAGCIRWECAGTGRHWSAVSWLGKKPRNPRRELVFTWNRRVERL